MEGWRLCWGRGEIAQNRYARDQGISYARDHLSRVPLVVVARLGRAFGVYDAWRELEVESVFEGRSTGWSRTGYVLYLALIPFGVIGWRSARRTAAARDVFVLLIPIFAVTFSVAVGYGNHRFRMPLEPSLVVLGAIGLERVFVRRERVEVVEV